MQSSCSVAVAVDAGAHRVAAADAHHDAAADAHHDAAAGAHHVAAAAAHRVAAVDRAAASDRDDGCVPYARISTDRDALHKWESHTAESSIAPDFIPRGSADGSAGVLLSNVDHTGRIGYVGVYTRMNFVKKEGGFE